MIKIYIEDNYIIFEEQDGNKITEHKKQVIITPHFQDTRFVIKNIRQYPNREFDVNPLLIKNKVGVDYTIQTFKDLVVTETGVYGKAGPDNTNQLNAIVVNTQQIEDKLDELKPLLIDIDNNTDTLETSNDAIVVNTQQIEDKIDLLKPKFEIGIELVDGANGSNVGVDFTYTIPQSIHQMSMISEVKIGTATSKGSITSNYVLTAGVLQVFSVGTMNGQYIWINGTKI